MQSFSRLVLRHAGWVALLGTLLAFVGGYYSVQLYKNLRTDIEELLPTTARSVVDLKEVTRRLESIDSLTLLIFSPDPVAGKRFQIDLARKLSEAPRSVISSVEYKIDRELEFFRKRQALYMDLSDIEKIRHYIEARIEYEKELYNPLNIFGVENLAEPKLDFEQLRQKYAGRMSAYSRFPEGYYASPDGGIRIVLAYLPGKSMDRIHALKDAAMKAVEELDPKSYSPALEVKFAGGVEETLQEHEALIADLGLSSVIVVLLVSAAMLIFFRSFRATAALVASTFAGTFWTFGLSYFVVGYLNANSAFMGSIVIGNGINFGIILLARYLEERRRGRSNSRANFSALVHTATSTWTAALAAGLSYGSLMLTSFRGFSQFGVIGLLGMVLCWISAFTLLPAYLTILDRISSLVPRTRKSPRSFVSNAIARVVQGAPGPIWAVSLVITLASLAAFTRYSPDILETNLGKLRNKHSLEHGAAYLSRYADEVFQRYLSPLVILPDSRKDAIRIASVLKAQKEKEGSQSLLASVQTLDDFLPQDQYEKIKLLKEIRALLPPRLMRRLSSSDQDLVQSFLTNESLTPVNMNDLPQLLLRKFTEKDGTLGKMVLVEPPLGQATWKGEKLIQLIHDLRAAADSVSPGTPVAGGIAVTSDMIQAVSHDGPRATLFAFIAVVVLVLFLFRNLQTASLVLFSLMLGVLWLAGLILGFDLKINFLNFIALPITFGIGVDYGVNIFQRYREEGGQNIVRVIRDTGSAVGLCSVTTIIGYSSLLIASNQGFVSFGRLAVAGEITCVIAALISLPAYLVRRDRRRKPATA